MSLALKWDRDRRALPRPVNSPWTFSHENDQTETYVSPGKNEGATGVRGLVDPHSRESMDVNPLLYFPHA